MLLALLLKIGANEGYFFAFFVKIFTAVQQIADVELVFRLVVFQAKDLARFVAVRAEIAVRAGDAAFDLNALGQTFLQCGKCLFPSMTNRPAPIILKYQAENEYTVLLLHP